MRITQKKRTRLYATKTFFSSLFLLGTIDSGGVGEEGAYCDEGVLTVSHGPDIKFDITVDTFYSNLKIS